MSIPTHITLADYLEITNLAYEWASTYDAKDWDHLKTLFGPSIRFDFRSLHGPLEESLTPDQFVTIVADKKVIGDPRVKTQHLLGGGKWTSPGDETVQVWWQLRVAHQRYAAEDLATPINKGHGHGANQHTYKKIDGVWKIVGIEAKNGWVEGDLFGTLHPPDEA